MIRISPIEPTALRELVVYVVCTISPSPSGSFNNGNLKVSAPRVIVWPDVELIVNIPV